MDFNSGEVMNSKARKAKSRSNMEPSGAERSDEEVGRTTPALEPPPSAAPEIGVDGLSPDYVDEVLLNFIRARKADIETREILLQDEMERAELDSNERKTRRADKRAKKSALKAERLKEKNNKDNGDTTPESSKANDDVASTASGAAEKLRARGSRQALNQLAKKAAPADPFARRKITGAYKVVALEDHYLVFAQPTRVSSRLGFLGVLAVVLGVFYHYGYLVWGAPVRWTNAGLVMVPLGLVVCIVALIDLLLDKRRRNKAEKLAVGNDRDSGVMLTNLGGVSSQDGGFGDNSMRTMTGGGLAMSNSNTNPIHGNRRARTAGSFVTTGNRGLLSNNRMLFKLRIQGARRAEGLAFLGLIFWSLALGTDNKVRHDCALNHPWKSSICAFSVRPADTAGVLYFYTWFEVRRLGWVALLLEQALLMGLTHRLDILTGEAIPVRLTRDFTLGLFFVVTAILGLLLAWLQEERTRRGFEMWIELKLLQQDTDRRAGNTNGLIEAFIPQGSLQKLITFQPIHHAGSDVVIALCRISKFPVWSSQFAISTVPELLNMLYTFFDQQRETYKLQLLRNYGDSYLVSTLADAFSETAVGGPESAKKSSSSVNVPMGGHYDGDGGSGEPDHHEGPGETATQRTVRTITFCTKQLLAMKKVAQGVSVVAGVQAGNARLTGGIDLSVQIGVSTGTLVGGLFGGDQKLYWNVGGPAYVEASNLCRDAPDAQILAGPRAVELTAANFTYQLHKPTHGTECARWVVKSLRTPGISARARVLAELAPPPIASSPVSAIPHHRTNSPTPSNPALVDLPTLVGVNPSELVPSGPGTVSHVFPNSDPGPVFSPNRSNSQLSFSSRGLTVGLIPGVEGELDNANNVMASSFHSQFEESMEVSAHLKWENSEGKKKKLAVASTKLLTKHEQRTLFLKRFKIGKYANSQSSGPAKIEKSTEDEPTQPPRQQQQQQQLNLADIPSPTPPIPGPTNPFESPSHTRSAQLVATSSGHGMQIDMTEFAPEDDGEFDAYPVLMDAPSSEDEEELEKEEVNDNRKEEDKVYVEAATLTEELAFLNDNFTLGNCTTSFRYPGIEKEFWSWIRDEAASQNRYMTTLLPTIISALAATGIGSHLDTTVGSTFYGFLINAAISCATWIVPPGNRKLVTNYSMYFSVVVQNVVLAFALFFERGNMYSTIILLWYLVALIPLYEAAFTMNWHISLAVNVLFFLLLVILNVLIDPRTAVVSILLGVALPFFYGFTALVKERQRRTQFLLSKMATHRHDEAEVGRQVNEALLGKILPAYVVSVVAARLNEADRVTTDLSALIDTDGCVVDALSDLAILSVRLHLPAVVADTTASMELSVQSNNSNSGGAMGLDFVTVPPPPTVGNLFDGSPNGMLQTAGPLAQLSKVDHLLSSGIAHVQREKTQWWNAGELPPNDAMPKRDQVLISIIRIEGDEATIAGPLQTSTLTLGKDGPASQRGAGQASGGAGQVSGGASKNAGVSKGGQASSVGVAKAVGAEFNDLVFGNRADEVTTELLTLGAYLRDHVRVTGVFGRGDTTAVVLGQEQPRFDLVGYAPRVNAALVAAAPEGSFWGTDCFIRWLPGGANSLQRYGGWESGTPSMWRVQGAGMTSVVPLLSTMRLQHLVLSTREIGSPLASFAANRGRLNRSQRSESTRSRDTTRSNSLYSSSGKDSSTKSSTGSLLTKTSTREGGSARTGCDSVQSQYFVDSRDSEVPLIPSHPTVVRPAQEEEHLDNERDFFL